MFTGPGQRLVKVLTDNAKGRCPCGAWGSWGTPVTDTKNARGVVWAGCANHPELRFGRPISRALYARLMRQIKRLQAPRAAAAGPMLAKATPRRAPMPIGAAWEVGDMRAVIVWADGKVETFPEMQYGRTAGVVKDGAHFKYRGSAFASHDSEAEGVAVYTQVPSEATA